MRGLYARPLRAAFMGGLYGWPLRAAFMGGLYGWPLCAAFGRAREKHLYHQILHKLII